MALGRSWHPEEFTCSQCKAVLEEGGFFEERGAVYCTKCHDNRYAPNCAKCKKKIIGVRASVVSSKIKTAVSKFLKKVNLFLPPPIRKSCMHWRWLTMFSVSSVQPARILSGIKPFTWRRVNPTVREVSNWTIAVQTYYTSYIAYLSNLNANGYCVRVGEGTKNKDRNGFFFWSHIHKLMLLLHILHETTPMLWHSRLSSKGQGRIHTTILIGSDGYDVLCCVKYGVNSHLV